MFSGGRESRREDYYAGDRDPIHLVRLDKDMKKIAMAVLLIWDVL